MKHKVDDKIFIDFIGGRFAIVERKTGENNQV
jgi:hypothetical protein